MCNLSLIVKWEDVNKPLKMLVVVAIVVQLLSVSDTLRPHGISQARMLEYVAISFSRDLPNLAIKPATSALACRVFTVEPPGKLKKMYISQNDRGLMLYVFSLTSYLCAISNNIFNSIFHTCPVFCYKVTLSYMTFCVIYHFFSFINMLSRLLSPTSICAITGSYNSLILPVI